MRFSETSIGKTRLEMAEIVRLMEQHCEFARAQQTHGAPGVALVFRHIALLERCQERGEILTPIMQLPPRIATLLMEYVNHEGPWEAHPPIDLWITLRNNGKATLRNVITDRWWQPGINMNTGAEEDENGWWVYEKQDLPPGESIQLKPHWAATLLRKYCRRACNMTYWGKWKGLIGEEDVVEEVGYRVSLPRLDKETAAVEVRAPVDKPKRRARQTDMEVAV